MIDIFLEQRIVVKFHVKLGKTATETLSLLKQVYGDSCLSRSRFFEWFKRFKDGRDDVEDDARPGRPSTSKTAENIEKIGNLVRTDRRLTIRMISENIGIDKECVRQILHDTFEMKKVCAKMVPKNLTLDQMEARKNICADTLNHIENDPNFLERVITCDYSPDVAPCDFYLFPKVKSALKGTRFQSVEAVQRKAAAVMKELTQNDFKHCFEQWKIRMERCRDRGGVYIEGDTN